MNSSGHKTGVLLLGLLTGVCLAAAAAHAADSSTTSTAPKPVPHSAHSTATPTHTITKKAATPIKPTHSASDQRVTPHSVTVPHPATSTTHHASYAPAVKRPQARTTAYAARSKGAPVHARPVRTLNGQQRLARLHLQPERTQAIQQALIREGYLQGDANGQWDARTHDAMLKYQTDHGFPATGLPEAKSLMKLGLGAHPLPPELDHGTAGVVTPNGAQGDLTVPSSSPPISQATPPS